MLRQEESYSKSLILRILRGRSIIGVSLLSFSLVGCGGGDQDGAGANSKMQKLLTVSDLGVRKGGDGSIFTSLSEAVTGVGFHNPIDTSHPLKRLYSLGYAAGGVAIGDLNGDGQPDLFFTSGPGKNAVYLQKPGGNLQFEEANEAGVGGGDYWGTGAVMVDIENDGDLDLYVCNYEAPNQLYVNDGKGLFTEQAELFGLAVVGACLMPTFADVDNDGDLDLYVLTNQFVRAGGQLAARPLAVGH